MLRREFVKLTAGAAVGWTLAAGAQQTKPMIGSRRNLAQQRHQHAGLVPRRD
jgi:hypothetical protein